ncbi:MAG: Multidrug resistance protein NorM [Phycisphaerae bacterium]|nr:Multidrug resistance protein NorM [Phycisphaerae bacterium]
MNLETHEPQFEAAGGELQRVLRMSIPMVISTCSPMIMRIVDFTFVSRLGTEAQAAIVPAQMLPWCYIAMGMGVVSAVSTFAAQVLGKSQPQESGAYGWQSLYLSGLLGIGGLLFWPLIPGLIRLIDHAPEVQALEVDYIRVTLWSILPTLVAQALGSFFNGIHRPTITMRAAIEANGLNILMNYLLIFGVAGFPRMGFTGAAAGTLVAAVYQSGRLLLKYLHPVQAREFGTRQGWRWQRERMAAFLRISLPQGIQWLSEVVVWAIFINVLIGQFGTLALAASNVGWQYIRISFMPMVGVGQAVTALVGKAIGQQNIPQARRMTWAGVQLTMVYVGTLSVLYRLFSPELVKLFNQKEEVIAIGRQVLCCLAIFQFFDIIGQTFYYALRGAGDTRWPMVVFVISHWLILIGGGSLISYWLPSLGSVGPWMMATLLIILVAALLMMRWQGSAWEKINIFRQVASPTPLTDGL